MAHLVPIWHNKDWLVTAVARIKNYLLRVNTKSSARIFWSQSGLRGSLLLFASGQCKSLDPRREKCFDPWPFSADEDPLNSRLHGQCKVWEPFFEKICQEGAMEVCLSSQTSQCCHIVHSECEISFLSFRRVAVHFLQSWRHEGRERFVSLSGASVRPRGFCRIIYSAQTSECKHIHLHSVSKVG